MITGSQPGMGLAQTSASAVLAQNLGIWPGTIPPPPIGVSDYFGAFGKFGNEATFKETDSANYAKGE